MSRQVYIPAIDPVSILWRRRNQHVAGLRVQHEDREAEREELGEIPRPWTEGLAKQAWKRAERQYPSLPDALAEAMLHA